MRRVLREYHQNQYGMEPDALVRGQYDPLTEDQINAASQVQWRSRTRQPRMPMQ